VNKSDPDAVAQVTRWRKEPFNPYLLADLRPVTYMKRTVMSYLDNLIAWADNLFSSDSREALNEATLLYIMAAEILGPQPDAVTPPKHLDESFKDLAPKLDNFANGLANVENMMGGGSGGSGGSGMPPLHTFYFKVPPNEKLLGYWETVADRLFKLRHCQNITGVTRELAMFDAPIDPALLIKAQAAGVDIGSVLTDVSITALPNYRFTALYSQALDFVNAVRAYGSLLLTALEKADAAALTMLQQTTAQQLLGQSEQIFQWQIDKANRDIAALTESLAIAQSKSDFNHSQEFVNAAEAISVGLRFMSSFVKTVAANTRMTSSLVHLFPNVTTGTAGIGGTPVTLLTMGNKNVAESLESSASGQLILADIFDASSALATSVGAWQRRRDSWEQAAKEADIQIRQTNQALEGLQLTLQITQQNQVNYRKQMDNLEQQIDFLTAKFTNEDLYDWMVAQLAQTYFQSYRLAYGLCKRAERSYRYELGLSESSFIKFGYWDSLKKGLLAGETLNHDLRQMQASYLDRNSRRFEISRYISLAALDWQALVTLMEKGSCDFNIPETLFDNDYPGHYQRRLVRVSLTIVYPVGKLDNVKATLTMTANSVRVKDDLNAPLATNYAAVPQKIALSNAQDDPGLFLTMLSNNLSDQRYLPFEGAGAISSWHLELPAANNEIDLTTVGDVIIHLYYTALDGRLQFKQAIEAKNKANLPKSGLKAFSVVNDFVTEWGNLLATPAANTDQMLTLSLSPSRFPNWTRGKRISITRLNLLAVSWDAGDFVLEPQAPLPTNRVTLSPVTGVKDPYVSSGDVALTNQSPGKWSFKIRRSATTDFRSLTRNDLGDLLLITYFDVT